MQILHLIQTTTLHGLAYAMKSAVNRCSVVPGPWQFGKVDQGSSFTLGSGAPFWPTVELHWLWGRWQTGARYFACG